jgi:hypothetical protein
VKSLISKLAVSSLSTAKSKEKVMTLPVEMSDTPPDVKLESLKPKEEPK